MALSVKRINTQESVGGGGEGGKIERSYWIKKKTGNGVRDIKCYVTCTPSKDTLQNFQART